MTARLLLKALRLLWPYLRSAIFKDRTVAEVIRENAHITVMLVFVICLIMSLALSTLKLSELKELNRVRKVEVITLSCSCDRPLNTQRLQELLRER